MISLTFALLFATSINSEPTLADKLKTVAKSHQGDVAIAVVHLGTGDSYYLNADKPMPTASLIKLPILVEVYLQAQKKKLKLDTMLKFSDENNVIGSGILHDHFTPGAMFSLKDTCGLMICYSDNSATNMILDVVSMKEVNDCMESLELPNTKVYGKVYLGSKTTWNKAALAEYGLGSTTAREMASLCKMLHDGNLGDRITSDKMLAIMKTCDDTDKFPRFLPENVTVEHKTGSVSDARTAAGILRFQGGPVALCVLTNNNKDTSWTIDNAGDKLCADIAKIVYDHYKE